MPILHSRISILGTAIERANNHRLLNRYPDSLASVLAEDAKPYEKVLVELIQGAQATAKNKDLSATGRKKRLKELQQNALDKIPSSTLQDVAQGVETLNKKSINLVVQELDRHTPQGSKTVAFLQEREMRDYLFMLRKQAQDEHNKRILHADAYGESLSDEEREFEDPVEKLFLEACKTFDESKAQLVRAAITAPYPVQLLPDHIIDEGKEQLLQVTNPEHCEQLQAAEGRLAMLQILETAALEIIQRPDKAILSQDTPTMPVPDKQAA